jgi:hypothetical protein
MMRAVDSQGHKSELTNFQLLIDSTPALIHKHLIPLRIKNLSDGEDDSAEGADLNQVTQSLSRFGQREGLSYDWSDFTGLKQRDDTLPGGSQGCLRLSEQYEALDARLLPNQICHVDSRLASA